jgi:raffinose/stachyose/melibiose transport system permease protein
MRSTSPDTRRLHLPHLVWVVVRWLIVVPLALLYLFPLIDALGTAIKANGTAVTDLSILPSDQHWDNFIYVVQQTSLPTYFKNSTVITSLTVLLVVGCGALAGFGFSRLRFPGRNLLYVVFLCGLMVPVVVIVVPLFQMVRFFGLFNTYGALVGPYAALGLPLSVMIFRTFFDGTPGALEDAARIDGCSNWGIFLLVMLPLALPALIAVAVLQAVTSWNEFLLALLFMTRDDMRTVPLAIIPFIGQFGNQTEYMFATLLLISVPPLILFVLLQRYFQIGLTAGSIKG